jgi:hypothetical protein
MRVRRSRCGGDQAHAANQHGGDRQASKRFGHVLCLPAHASIFAVLMAAVMGS